MQFSCPICNKMINPLYERTFQAINCIKAFIVHWSCWKGIRKTDKRKELLKGGL